ncbi:nucleoside ABC transporter membrane protein [Desulforamulus reducens MI-1]|uniref:Nucleoside ABC transporter membrane protein n=1 Tax=Desulforamulus reducens (strain ATCC BAA-1160 / DSM 100696 / MI-1) TaxID=349161 RepID=A4J6I9_DESRM|nr:ABC transporter permease [Desulforamulus reducens]ABO50692.1 nucleoside ABC transporter membrane protein [Desulforamulus reducens MI-1]
MIKLERRSAPSLAGMILIPLTAIFLALITGAIFLYINGLTSPKGITWGQVFAVYFGMLEGAVGSSYGLSETIVKAIPLMLCGLGVSIAFRMQLWNIGAEGQFHMGAFGAAWVALNFSHLPAYVMLPLMVLAGIICGGIWGLLPGIPRAYLGVNETITTLMLNYVAILWVNYLVFGPWKDPQGMNFPLSKPFEPSAILPTLGNSRVHFGLVFALVIAVFLWFALRQSRWGYEVTVIGESSRAASYAGMNITKNILMVMFLSGAMAGLAGMAEVSAIAQRMQQGISPGYGYTAIIVAWLGKLNPFAILFVSFLLGALQVGGYSVQSSGVPAAIVFMIQGALLFFILGGEIFNRYKIVYRGKTKMEV